MEASTSGWPCAQLRAKALDLQSMGTGTQVSEGSPRGLDQVGQGFCPACGDAHMVGSPRPGTGAVSHQQVKQEAPPDIGASERFPLLSRGPQPHSAVSAGLLQARGQADHSKGLDCCNTLGTHSLSKSGSYHCPVSLSWVVFGRLAPEHLMIIKLFGNTKDAGFA